MMATYMIDGRLTRDSELKTTKDGKSFLKFSIAWNRKGKDAHFYDCSMFGERGSKLLPYLKKGKYVICVGEPDWSEYNGKTYETIVVDKLNFVGGRDEEPKRYEFSKEELDIADEVWDRKPAEKGPETWDDADIPF